MFGFSRKKKINKETNVIESLSKHQYECGRYSNHSFIFIGCQRNPTVIYAHILSEWVFKFECFSCGYTYKKSLGGPNETGLSETEKKLVISQLDLAPKKKKKK